MHTYINRNIYTQTDIHNTFMYRQTTDRQTDKHTNTHTDKHIQAYTQREREEKFICKINRDSEWLKLPSSTIVTLYGYSLSQHIPMVLN